MNTPRIGLRAKLLLSVSLLIVMASVALGQFFARHEAVNIRRSVVSRGISLARGFAYNCEYGTFANDEQMIRKIAQGVLREPGVVYCSVYDEQGALLARLERDGQENIRSRLRESYLQEPQTDQGVEIKTFELENGEQIYEFSCSIHIQREKKAEEEMSLFFGDEVLKDPGKDDELAIAEVVRSAAGPVQSRGPVVGEASVGISLAEMNARLAREKRLAILLTLLVVGVSLSLTVPVIQTIVEPIRDLVLGTKRIANGDLSLRVRVKSRDEIGNLAESFNQMIEDLRTSREEIEEYNRTLEQRVAERTADLERRNREISELNRSLREAQAQLVTSARLAAMGEMSAEIGHELNNYIAVISGRADLIPMTIERGDLDKAMANARIIADQTSRIQVLTNGLMDSSRQDTREIDCDLGDLIEQTVAFVQPQNKYDRTHFSIDIQDSLPTMCLDPQQMQQVLLNLFSNAADAIGPERDGEITVRVHCRAEHDEAVVEVQDNGPGIPKELLQRIFEPSFTTKKHGHGFGLAVCRRVVMNHRGQISVSSNPKWGTVFRLTLPVNRLAEEAARKQTDMEAEILVETLV
ncbi:MAG: HAMP domain-containing protein [Candidatus Eisenbacteria sp.]|nr:HAMP domain-containing protein [Candidatus Eisenbacteria bacterium]